MVERSSYTRLTMVRFHVCPHLRQGYGVQAPLYAEASECRHPFRQACLPDRQGYGVQAPQKKTYTIISILTTVRIEIIKPP